VPFRFRSCYSKRAGLEAGVKIQGEIPGLHLEAAAI